MDSKEASSLDIHDLVGRMSKVKLYLYFFLQNDDAAAAAAAGLLCNSFSSAINTEYS
jgi:hypothetical protein